MKKLVFILDKTENGYSAYSAHPEVMPVKTKGRSIGELRQNLLKEINNYQVANNSKQVSEHDYSIKLNFRQFLEFYKEVDIEYLFERLNLDKGLIQEYLSGSKEPSKEDLERILTGVKQLGAELQELHIV